MAHLLLKRLGAEVTHTASAHIPLARASCTTHLGTRGPAKQGAGEAPALRSGRGRMNLVVSVCPAADTAWKTLNTGRQGMKAVQEKHLRLPRRWSSQGGLPRRGGAEVIHEG